MKCTTCGESLEQGILFCPNCGARAPQPPVSAGSPTIALPAAANQPGASAEPQGVDRAAPPILTQPYDSLPAPATPQWATPGQSAYAPASLPNSTAAVISLVFGVLTWLPILPAIGAIVAVVAGHIARRQIRESNGQLGGSGMALAGLILGYSQIAVLALVICAIIAIGFLTLLGSKAS
jgi:hypothetical protein